MIKEAFFIWRGEKDKMKKQRGKRFKAFEWCGEIREAENTCPFCTQKSVKVNNLEGWCFNYIVCFFSLVIFAIQHLIDK